MINWGGFNLFFKTGIPSELLYPSLLLTLVGIIDGLFWKKRDKEKSFVLWVLLAEYAFIVICSTIICRGGQSFKYARLELETFWTYKAVVAHTPGVSVWDIVLNVVLFVPLGLLVKSLYTNMRLWKMALIAVCCSVFIETNQYFFEKGIAQIDDVMHNTIGALFGWGIAKLVQSAWFLDEPSGKAERKFHEGQGRV